MSDKSIIIIGAGMAGLSAGCYARMNGYRTRIFEAHDLPGGLCTSWKRKGYTFDGCIHYLGGSSSGAIHRFLEELGAVHNRPCVDHDEFKRIVDAGGKTLIVYSDVDRLGRHMKELSPEDSDVVDEICNAVRIFSTSAMPADKPAELMNIVDLLKMLKSGKMMTIMRKLGKISHQDYAKKFRDPFLRKSFPLILLDLPDFPAAWVFMILSMFHSRNAGWPKGGSLSFSQAIEKRYLGLGGEIAYKSPVEKILVESNRAAGVHLEDGSEHRADIVISAADGHSTIFDMLDGRYVNEEIRNYYDNWPIYKGYLQVSLGVAKDLSHEPHAIIMNFDRPVSIGEKTYDFAELSHYSYDPAMAPAGKSVVAVSFVDGNYRFWKELRGQDPARYKAEKRILADRLIDEAERHYHGIRDKIEVVDVATPVTYERYTRNWLGSHMGWLNTTKNGIAPMKRGLPGLANFYMAGQWVYFGGGVTGAILSARHLVQVICNKDKRRFTATVPDENGTSI